MGKCIPPQIPRPRSQDRLPFLPSFSLESVIIRREVSCSSVYTQGVSDSNSNASFPCKPGSCQITARSGWIAIGIPGPPSPGGGDLCNVCIPETWLKGHGSGGIAHLLWLGRPKRFKTCSEMRRQKKKTTRDRKCKTDLGLWGKDFWLIYNPQSNHYKTLLFVWIIHYKGCFISSADVHFHGKWLTRWLLTEARKNSDIFLIFVNNRLLFLKKPTLDICPHQSGQLRAERTRLPVLFICPSVLPTPTRSPKCS